MEYPNRRLGRVNSTSAVLRLRAPKSRRPPLLVTVPRKFRRTFSISTSRHLRANNSPYRIPVFTKHIQGFEFARTCIRSRLLLNCASASTRTLLRLPWFDTKTDTNRSDAWRYLADSRSVARCRKPPEYAALADATILGRKQEFICESEKVADSSRAERVPKSGANMGTFLL